jgi:hypothetical protein
MLGKRAKAKGVGSGGPEWRTSGCLIGLIAQLLLQEGRGLCGAAASLKPILIVHRGANARTHRVHTKILGFALHFDEPKQELIFMAIY